MARHKSLMQALDADRRDAAFALLERKTHALTFVQLAQTGVLHGADMHENIVTAGVGGDKSVTLTGIEPFDDAGERFFLPYVVVLSRFHVDTFHTGLVPGAGHYSRRSFPPTAVIKRNRRQTSIVKMCCIAADILSFAAADARFLRQKKTALRRVTARKRFG